MTAAVVLGCAGAFAGSAAAATDLTWSGADTATPTPNWSDAANWVGDIAPASSATIGALSFPVLSSNDCTSAQPVGTCYVSNNDVAGLKIGQLTIDEGAYDIGGDEITLDGGLRTTGGAPVLNLPVKLGHAQTWDLTTGLNLGSALTGAHALTIRNPAQFGLRGDNEIGPVSITGGVLYLYGAGLNGADANAVTLTHSGLAIYGASSAMGALRTVGSDVTLGLPGAGAEPVTLTVASGTFDSASTFAMKLGSEISSQGPIALGGATLGLDPTETPCDPNSLGTLYTLVATTGALTGTFGNAAQGSVLSDGCDQYRINYHKATPTKTVTATLLGSPTTTSLTATPNPAVAQQPVTLQATVTSHDEPGALIGGTVAFKRRGTVISGCGAVSVTYVGSAGDYVASCQTSFAGRARPVPLRAVFTPPAGSNDRPSTGTTTLAVNKAS